MRLRERARAGARCRHGRGRYRARCSDRPDSWDRVERVGVAQVGTVDCRDKPSPVNRAGRISLMRRPVVTVVLGLAAIGSALVVTGALRGAGSNLVPNLGFYDAVFVIGRDGADLRQLTRDQRFHGYAWSPDGRWIASVTTSVDPNGVDVPGPLELVEPPATTVQDVRLGGFGSNVLWQSNRSLKLLVTQSVSNLVDTRLLDIRPRGVVRRVAWTDWRCRLGAARRGARDRPVRPHAAAPQRRRALSVGACTASSGPAAGCAWRGGVKTAGGRK